MPRRIIPNTPPSFKKINVQRAKVKSKPMDFSNPVAATRAAERLREKGARMFEWELAELARMENFRERHQKRMLGFMQQPESADGRITKAQYLNSMKKVSDRIKQKIARIESLVEKRRNLLKPRTETVSRFAMNERAFPWLLGHTGFSTMVQRRLVERDKPHSVAMVDIDYLKRINSRFGSHIEGGNEVVTAYAKAADYICKAYPGTIASRYGADEFTFHFLLGAEDAQVAIEKFKGQARKNLESSIFGRAILQGKPLSHVKFVDRVDAALAKTKAGRAIKSAVTPLVKAKRLILPPPKFGTATASIIEVDFNFHYQNGESRRQLYEDLLDNVSQKLLASKTRRKRGATVIAKDDFITPKNIERLKIQRANIA